MLKTLIGLGLLSFFWLQNPVRAENPNHLQQLLSTRQCPKCDLSRAGLVYAKLLQVNLRGANLMQANLSRADLSGADLSGADLRGANLVGVNLSGANLKGADLTGADLRDAYLVGANLEQTILVNANVRKTEGLPGNAQSYYQWAMEDYLKGDPSLAIDSFNRAISLDKNFASAYLGRAGSRLRLNDRRGAVEDAYLAAQLYQSQGDDVGYKVAINFVNTVTGKNDPPPEGGGLMNILAPLAQYLVPFLF
ncbi:hypothetical protein BST81_19100 [Leptolyngbya sp. 'hensonii']|nr:hypothetical protein BST81_19100 [Leptolyngbya sp. 'hensonii']